MSANMAEDRRTADDPLILGITGWFHASLRREGKRQSEKCPLLDKLLPILEYTPTQLKEGGFLDQWLTAAVIAKRHIQKAADELEELGIFEEDLILLLNDRMRDQLKRQRRRQRKRLKAR